LKVVIDTNIIVSALINPRGPAGILLGSVCAGSVTVCLCPAIVEELERVVRYPRVRRLIRLEDVELERFLRQFVDVAEFVPGELEKATACSDEADNRFLELAQAVGADFIISGDDHLLSLGVFGQTSICRLQDFLQRMSV